MPLVRARVRACAPMCGRWAACLPRALVARLWSNSRSRGRRGQPRTFAPSADAVALTLAHYFGD